MEEPEALDLVPMLKCWAGFRDTSWLWVVDVLSNVVVELGPEARGDPIARSAAARPDGRAGSETQNDLSL